MKTKTIPPIQILDILHKCEEAGIELSPEIQEWWEEETIAQELERIPVDWGEEDKL